MTENILIKTEGDERPSVYFGQEQDGDSILIDYLEIIYKNVRKAKIPNTADIAYCEIRITELQAQLDAQRELTFRLEQQQDQFVTYEQTISQLQERNQILSDENKQLTLSLRTRARDLDQSKFKILEYESQLERLRDIEQDYNNTIQLLQLREKELKELTEKYGKLELQIQQQKVLELENFDLQNKITNLSNDLEQQKDRYAKIENERKRLADLQQQISTSKVEIKSEILTSTTQATVQQPQSDYYKFKGQLQEQQETITSMKNAIFERDHKLGLLNNEVERLSEQMAEKNNLASQIKQLQDENDQLQKEIQRLNEQLKQKPVTVVKTVEKIIKISPSEADEEKLKLQQELENANFNLEKLKFDLSQLQQKLETQESIISDLSREVRQIVQLNEEIELLKLDKANLLSQLSQKEQDQEFSLKLLNQKTLELQNLDKIKFNLRVAEEQLQIKQREILALKRRVGDVENSNNQLKQLQPELKETKNIKQKLQNDNQSLEQQLQQLNINLNDAEVVINQLKKLESKINSVQATNSSLRTEITESQNETEQWRQKYNTCASENIRLQRLLEVNQQRQNTLSEQNKNFQKDFSIPQVSVEAVPAVSRIAKQVVQDDEKIGQFKNNIVQMQLQLDSLNRKQIFEQQDFQRQIDDQNTLYLLKKGECEQWKQKYLKSERENTNLMNLKDRYNELLQRYDSQDIIIQNLTEKLKQTSVELEKTRSEAFGLHLQLTQLNSLTQERDQYKEQTQIYYEEIQNQYKQVPLLKAEILSLKKQLRLADIPIVQIQQKSDAIEKYRQQVLELEQQIDDTLEDQIAELQKTIAQLQNEVTRQVDQNGQLVKDLQNSERKRQDILIELQLIQAEQLDNQQLKVAFLNKQKQNDDLRMENDQVQFKQRDLEHNVKLLHDQNQDQKNQIEAFKDRNEHLTIQLTQLQLNYNQLQQENIDQKYKLNLFPELQEKIVSQANQLATLNNNQQKLSEAKDKLQAQCTLQEIKLQNLGPLQSRIESIELILEERQRQLDVWQTKAIELENSKGKLNEEWRKKFDKLESQLKNQIELEGLLNQQAHDVDGLLSQNKKLNASNKELLTQNSSISKDNDNKDIEIKRLQAVEADFRKLNENLLIELQRIADLTEKLQILQNQYDAAKRDQERLENKCAMMSSEIERLSVMVKNKNVEIEGNKALLHQNQQQLDQVQPLFTENKRLFDELNNAFKVNDELKLQNAQNLKIIDELKSKINNEFQQQENLKQEMDQGEEIIRHKDNEINELKVILRQSENQLREVKRDDQQWIDQQSEKEKLTNQLNYVNELFQQKSIENEGLVKQNHQLQSQLLDNQKLDFEHLELTLATRNKDIEQFKIIQKQLQQEIQKLVQQKLENETKLNTVDLEIERWKRKANSNVGEIEMLRGTIDQLNDEIDRLNKNTLDLLTENDSWRQKYGNLQQLIPQMVNLQPNPETQAYQVTPGNSFRIPPNTDRSQGSFRNQPPPLDSRRSFRRATITTGLSKP